jgi:threonine/homoserine/homoserine lactone efflux protein
MTVGALLASGFAGVVFGLALAAPPGPMNAVIAEESAIGGWRSGFVAGLGAMTADLCFLVLSLLGAVTVVQRAPRLRAAMIGVGGLLLLYFAVGALRDARESYRRDPPEVEDRRGFLRAFVLAITNPYQLVFWLTVGLALLRHGTLDVFAEVPYLDAVLSGVLVVETGSPALLVGLFGGIAVWIVGFPAVIAAGRERADRFAPLVAAVSAVAFAGFGVVFLLDAASTLL